MSKQVQVETGARGIRGVEVMAQAVDGPVSALMLDQALHGEGVLYYNKQRKNDWIVVRNVPALTNNNGEISREALRIEIKFEDGLYLLRNDDPDKELKEKKIKSLPDYGTNIRPMSEITRETKAKAQAEAIKILTGLTDKDTMKTLLAELAPKLEQSDVTKAAIDEVLLGLSKE